MTTLHFMNASGRKQVCGETQNQPGHARSWADAALGGRDWQWGEAGVGAGTGPFRGIFGQTRRESWLFAA